MQSVETGIVPEVCAEIRRHRHSIAAEKDTEENQSQQRRNLGGGKSILDDGAGLHAENIDDREHDDDQDGDEVLRVQSNIHAAERHGADGESGYFPDVDNPITRRNGRPEDTEEFAESHAHGGDRAGLNHEKQSPSVEKTPEWAERLPQVNILPARTRHHGREFAVGERADNGEEAGDEPGANQQRRRSDLARNFGGNNKDARADHRAHHQHGGAGEAQTFDQLFVLMGAALPIAGVQSDFRSGSWGWNVRAHEPPTS